MSCLRLEGALDLYLVRPSNKYKLLSNGLPRGINKRPLPNISQLPLSGIEGEEDQEEVVCSEDVDLVCSGKG